MLTVSLTEVFPKKLLIAVNSGHQFSTFSREMDSNSVFQPGSEAAEDVATLNANYGVTSPFGFPSVALFLDPA